MGSEHFHHRRARPPPRRTSNCTLVRGEPRELRGVVLFGIASSKTRVKREIGAQITAVPGDWTRVRQHHSPQCCR